jgi:hypothetical protein
MIPKILVSVVPCLLLSACVSRIPFVDAERGSVFSLDSFERVLIDEKIQYLELETEKLKEPEPTDPNIVKLSPFMLRKYPTLSEWRKMKAKAKPGDVVAEYHHRLYLKYVDGPAETDRRGFALIRNGQIIDFVFIDGIFPSDY